SSGARQSKGVRSNERFTKKPEVVGVEGPPEGTGNPYRFQDLLYGLSKLTCTRAEMGGTCPANEMSSSADPRRTTKISAANNSLLREAVSNGRAWRQGSGKLATEYLAGTQQ